MVPHPFAHVQVAASRAVRAAAAGCALALLTMPLLSGCGVASSGGAADGGDAAATSATSGQPLGPTITIGVAADLPGLGYWHDGSYSGFDVDVARHVAKTLGYGSQQIVFVRVEPQDRAAVLQDGRADMVVAGYAMTDESAQAVTFAGPYLETRPAVLVHDDDTSLDDLFATGDDRMNDDREDNTEHAADDATVCAATGTAMHARVASRDDVTLSDYDTYGRCMTALMAGTVDAVAGDDATLPGLARHRRESYRIVADDRGDDALRYGIAVRHGYDELANKIAGALRAMIDDGSWRRYVDADLTPLGYRTSRDLSARDVTVH
ncbi:transporter substrate-binding domain-containing protein [Bifidobacterium sp. 82T10]|uniref:Transporter substrate-binding domain-containing protein n=1 Tax=Bifidobacterium miconis TaxID=2834435 RepID=A0ABS6WEJ7_9BIFI|nr:transporter substrate-binding domain-containing protein [Bifidobacterium miconis]MBW3092292.1 transporter substrate-binding domain-containing protein [Bifidobacterium miconis]